MSSRFLFSYACWSKSSWTYWVSNSKTDWTKADDGWLTKPQYVGEEVVIGLLSVLDHTELFLNVKNLIYSCHESSTQLKKTHANRQNKQKNKQTSSSTRWHVNSRFQFLVIFSVFGCFLHLVGNRKQSVRVEVWCLVTHPSTSIYPLCRLCGSMTTSPSFLLYSWWKRVILSMVARGLCLQEKLQNRSFQKMFTFKWQSPKNRKLYICTGIYFI